MTPTFVFKRLLSFVKIALIANRVSFKTLSRSIYTSFMIKGGSQGVLKRRNYGSQVSVYKLVFFFLISIRRIYLNAPPDSARRGLALTTILWCLRRQIFIYTR